MALDFRPSADTHCVHVYRRDTEIGMLQWHPEREPRFVPREYQDVTMYELEELYRKLHECYLTVQYPDHH